MEEQDSYKVKTAVQFHPPRPIIGDGKEYCPQCDRALKPHKCKLICECGYFMSCSDF